MLKLDLAYLTHDKALMFLYWREKNVFLSVSPFNTILKFDSYWAVNL